jgi:hypothetical protein
LGEIGERPIEERIERQLVDLRIDADWLAELGGGASADHRREPRQSRPADLVEPGVAGTDVSKSGGQACPIGGAIGDHRLRIRSAGRADGDNQGQHRGAGAGYRPMPQWPQAQQAAQRQTGGEIDQRENQSRAEQPRPQVALAALTKDGRLD